MKSRAPPLQSSRLLDQVRERIRYMHYSLATEKVYLYWVRFFVRWSGRGGQMRHPRDIDAAGVEAFLTMLATERHVSASTHNQALSAILFLYREVLAVDLPWLDGINRPTRRPRIPSVLTRDEVAGVLGQMDGIAALLAQLLYGTGMRLMEAMRLRIKDVDFMRHVIIVREAKGGKDRVVMLPRALVPALRRQLLVSRGQWEADRHGQRGGVEITLNNNSTITGATGSTGGTGANGAAGVGGVGGYGAANTGNTAGSAGGAAGSGTSGGTGGIALSVSVAARLNNLGTLAGGAGGAGGAPGTRSGGGGGGGPGYTYGKFDTDAAGGNGGNGYSVAGGGPFAGGSPGGGAGGASGAAGVASATRAGGAAGAAGATGATGSVGLYISGNANVTWLATGTRTGGVA